MRCWAVAEDSFSKPLTARLFTFRSPQSNADIPSLCVPWSCCDHFTVWGEYLVHTRVACNEKFARKSLTNSNHDTNRHEFVFEMEPWSFMAKASSVCFQYLYLWRHQDCNPWQTMRQCSAGVIKFGDPVSMGIPDPHTHMRMGTPL